MNDKMINEILRIIKFNCNKLIEKENDWIFRIAINFFNDGECVDFGVRIVVCDLEEENFRNTYYSFTLENDEIAERVLYYLKEVGSENECQRQKHLAEGLKDSLLACSWIDSRTNIYVEEYD